GSTDQPLTSSILLPMSEASLALIPTLVTVSQPTSSSSVSSGTPAIVVQVSFTVGAALPAAGPINALPYADNSPSPVESPNSTVALNTFLDVKPTANGSEKSLVVQSVDVVPYEKPEPVSTDSREVIIERPSAIPFMKTLPIQPNVEMGPETS